MITYSNSKEVTADQLSEVFKSSGIIRPSDDFERLTRMLEGANTLWTAWDGAALVGVARAMTDFSYVCYLSDLAVAKPYQRQGIGKTLVAKLSQDLGDEVSVVLLAAPAAMGFYPQLGFERHKGAYIVPRKPF